MNYLWERGHQVTENTTNEQRIQSVVDVGIIHITDKKSIARVVAMGRVQKLGTIVGASM